MRKGDLFPEGVEMLNPLVFRHSLEEIVLQEMRRSGKELWESVLASLEETILTEREGEMIKKRRVYRHLLTCLGWIRFQRYQVAREGEGGKVYRYLLDEVLGLEPKQRETLGVRRRGVELASDHPYRQAAELLGEEIEEVLSHRTLHRWIQEEGRRQRGEEEAKRRRVFEEGISFPRDPVRKMEKGKSERSWWCPYRIP